MSSMIDTTESPHANMLDLLRYSLRARLQKTRNPSSNPLSQFEDDRSPHTNDAPQTRGVYSRSLKNPALHQLQKSSKSASTTPQRPIWNSFATVGVRDFLGERL